MSERDALLDALTRLDSALDENIARAERMKERIAELQAACESGQPLREFVPKTHTPPLVQLLSQSVEVLHTIGAHVRRAEAKALHCEGMTMDQIALLFGVSRQRVSALLRA